MPVKVLFRSKPQRQTLYRAPWVGWLAVLGGRAEEDGGAEVGWCGWVKVCGVGAWSGNSHVVMAPFSSAPAASPIFGAKPSARAGIFKNVSKTSVLPSGGIRCSLEIKACSAYTKIFSHVFRYVTNGEIHTDGLNLDVTPIQACKLNTLHLF